MPFNPLGFFITARLTEGVVPEERRAPINLIGGMLGPSPVGPVLLGIAAQQASAEAPPGGTPPAGEPAKSEEGGAAPEEVEVPALAGEEVEMSEAIEARGLVPEKVEVASTKPRGQLIGTRPESGSVVPTGTRVAVFVSHGLKVPDVRGRSFEEAASILSAAGFETVERKVQRKKVRAAETVEEQRPEPGGFAAPDEEIVLTVPTLAKSASTE